jgi:hypothetical protein
VLVCVRVPLTDCCEHIFIHHHHYHLLLFLILLLLLLLRLLLLLLLVLLLPFLLLLLFLLPLGQSCTTGLYCKKSKRWITGRVRVRSEPRTSMA